MRKLVISAMGLALVVASCRDRYMPDVISKAGSYLVVDGVLIAGGKPTKIMLSRTFSLDDSARIRWEGNATVIVENRQGTEQVLPMQRPGVYEAVLQLDMADEYRLRIITNDATEYLSDYVQPLVAASIDSIGWYRNVEGVRVYVNSDGRTAGSQYYMWNYDETFEIRSRYYSYVIYEDYRVRNRRIPEEEVYVCWKYDSSRNIIVNSAAGLSENIIHQAPVAFFYNGNEKLTVRYSMLLRQYAISKDAYEYLSLMRQNTENIGTIFDPQPSELRGNIHCVTRPGEPVIGYLMASTVEDKRAFISQQEIGPWPYSQFCPLDTVRLADAVDVFESGAYIPVESLVDGGTQVVFGYTISLPYCVDCRNRGGSLVKPPYW